MEHDKQAEEDHEEVEEDEEEDEEEQHTLFEVLPGVVTNQIQMGLWIMKKKPSKVMTCPRMV